MMIVDQPPWSRRCHFLKIQVASKPSAWGHHHGNILIVVEVGVRRGGEQFGGEKRDQLMVASRPT
jgi:hypothetical protein